MKTSRELLLLLIGVWLGLVIGLSFIEAPLKFQAPGMTLPLGLGIGRLVFGALNKIEICLSIILMILIYQYYRKNRKVLMLYLMIGSMVALQSFILLPILNIRVAEILAGNNVASSNHHIVFIVLEIGKLILLPILFHQIYKHKVNLSEHKI